MDAGAETVVLCSPPVAVHGAVETASAAVDTDWISADSMYSPSQGTYAGFVLGAAKLSAPPGIRRNADALGTRDTSEAAFAPRSCILRSVFRWVRTPISKFCVRVNKDSNL